MQRAGRGTSVNDWDWVLTGKASPADDKTTLELCNVPEDISVEDAKHADVGHWTRVAEPEGVGNKELRHQRRLLVFYAYSLHLAAGLCNGGNDAAHRLLKKASEDFGLGYELEFLLTGIQNEVRQQS